MVVTVQNIIQLFSRRHLLEPFRWETEADIEAFLCEELALCGTEEASRQLEAQILRRLVIEVRPLLEAESNWRKAKPQTSDLTAPEQREWSSQKRQLERRRQNEIAYRALTNYLHRRCLRKVTDYLESRYSRQFGITRGEFYQEVYIGCFALKEILNNYNSELDTLSSYAATLLKRNVRDVLCPKVQTKSSLNLVRSTSMRQLRRIFMVSDLLYIEKIQVLWEPFFGYFREIYRPISTSNSALPLPTDLEQRNIVRNYNLACPNHPIAVTDVLKVIEYMADQIRSATRVTTVSMDDERVITQDFQEPSYQEPEGVEPMAREIFGTVKAWLAALSPREKGEVLLSYGLNISQIAVAEILQISDQSEVSKDLKRVRGKLWEELLERYSNLLLPVDRSAQSIKNCIKNLKQPLIVICTTHYESMVDALKYRFSKEDILLALREAIEQDLQPNAAVSLDRCSDQEKLNKRLRECIDGVTES